MADRTSAQKRAAARAAIDEVQAGMIVGLGTGSTAAFAIGALGERVAAGLRITAAATSLRTASAAKAAGITIVDLPRSGIIDLCIDGVDEIDGALMAIKGGGGAMLREKVVAAAATRTIAIADASKRVNRLGRGPVPIEVLPFALALVMRRVADLGGVGTFRPSASTDQGNPILDAAFGPIADPTALATDLAAIPGVLGHGLFVAEIDALYLGTDAGVEKHARPSADRH